MLTAADRTRPPLTSDRTLIELRTREFARLDAEGIAYVDYGGAAIPPASLIREHHEHLTRSVLGNPHADHAASQASTDHIEAARAAVLRFVGADPDDYIVCFTANASAAIRLVGEAYPFGGRRPLVLSADNHNSIQGLREYARAERAVVHYVPLDGELRLDDPIGALTRARGPAGGLFAFPAQSNFSGVQHPLRLVREARALGYDVLLDAAAYVPTSRLRIAEMAPAFVVLSLYKIVGFPVQGALVARRDVIGTLRRPWFAGGTVEYASVMHDSHRFRAGEAAFEDGTPDFLGLAAVPAGLAWTQRVGIDRIHCHTLTLAGELLRGLDALRHASGAPAARVYGPAGLRARGACIAFNLLDAGGAIVDYARVERAAAAAGVALRGGCFCNPGASEHAFGYDRASLARCLGVARRRGFDRERLAECMNGRAAGAVRVSFGVANTDGDVARVLAVARGITRGVTLRP